MATGRGPAGVIRAARSQEPPLSNAENKPRLLVPEVVQTSAMDCGPASLKALLEGFGVQVSYGRLREACQTDVDGTSIDTMEDVARQLGLDVEQKMLPADHLFLPESKALPALVVVRLPNGQTHFVVVWSTVAGRAQVMDPGTGRSWPSIAHLTDDLYIHEMPVPESAWREWAGSDEFLAALRARLANLGASQGYRDRVIAEAEADAGWFGFGLLDATTRLVAALVRAGGLRRGDTARRLHESLLAAGREQGPPPPDSRYTAAPDPSATPQVIPRSFWSVRPLGRPEGADEEPQLVLRGVVLVQVRGRLPEGASTSSPEGGRTLSPELAAALTEKPARPLAALWAALRADGLLRPSALIGAMAVGALGVAIEALLFRSFFQLAFSVALPIQRLGAMVALLVFALALLALELPIQDGLLRLGRHVEIRLRVAFLEKIPRLGDRYFQSRPTSDMAERSHAAQGLRAAPALGAAVLRPLFAMLCTVVGIGWLDPGALPLALLAAVVAVGMPAAVWRVLVERDLRFRTHAGALGKFYLDALQGLIAVRTHGAERAVRGQQEELLTSWARAGFALQRVAIGVEGVEALVGLGLAALLVFDHLGRHAQGSGVLLLVYWALALPAYGAALATAARQYPGIRNLTLRLLEPLGAPDETEGLDDGGGAAGARAVGVSLDEVVVHAGGHTILDGVSLEIAPGEHVGVVGRSGAGKSTLVGLLLGWHRPSAGEVRVDGQPLRHEALARLRRHTAWVDPAVQLWNRSLADNLAYGNERADAELAFAPALAAAELREVLERLPDGLQTSLGESGGLLSGGQGQRVRLGRALLRPDARLVILDEPFRGLDRDKRRTLLARARERWRDATLLCITHDVGETRGFSRVLVVEDGHVVEDGAPEVLLTRPDGRYRALLEAEDRVREGLWGSEIWRRLWLAGGRVLERGRAQEGA